MIRQLKRHINLFAFIVIFLVSGFANTEVQAAAEMTSSTTSTSNSFANRSLGGQYKGPTSSTWDASPNVTGSSALKAPPLPGDPGGELEFVSVDLDGKTVLLLVPLSLLYLFFGSRRKNHPVEQ